MIAIVILLAIALAWKFQPQQAHRVIVDRVEIQRGKEYQWVPMLNGWFEVTKVGKSTQFKSAPPSAFRSKFGEYWPVLNLAVLIGYVLFMTYWGLAAWAMLPLTFTFTWNQTSGILASTPANWDDDSGSTTATQFSTTASSIPGHDGTPMQTRNSSDRLFAVGLRDSDGAAMIWYTDNDWTSTTEVVVDGTLAYGSVAIAVDSADNLYVLGQINSTTIRVLRSTNAGVGWSSPSADISSGTAGSGTGVNFAIDDDDFLHMMWDDTTSGFVRYCVSTIASPDPATIAVEDFKGGSAGTEQVSTGVATALFDMCLQASTRVVYDNLSGGPFQEGEVVSGPSGSGLVTTLRTLELSLIIISGSFANNDAISGGTSGATADVNGIPTTGFGVLFIYDSGGIDFRRKEDDVAWGDSSSPAVVAIRGTSGNPSVCVSDDDLVIFVSYGNPSAQASCKISTDGGDTFGSEVIVSVGIPAQTGTACGFGNGYFWIIHSDDVVNTFYTQFYADPTLSAPVLITTTEEDGTNAADSKRSARIRWTRFHHNTPGKLDMVWDNTTDSRLEGRVLGPSLPNISDAAVADGTSSSNMDLDLTPTGSLPARFASFTPDTGYGGTVNCSVLLAVAGGAITHKAGGLEMDNGYQCATFATFFNTFTTTRARGTCVATTSVTVAGNTTYDQSASTGNTTLTCPSITSLGTFRCRDNTVNDVILQGPDNSTYQEWVSGSPDLDFSGTTALVRFGTAATNRGLLINISTFSVGTGTLSIRNQSEFDSIDLDTSDLEILGTTRVVINKDWDSSTANSFTSNTSTVAFTGAVDGAYTITTDGTAGQAFNIIEWAENTTTATVSGDVYIGDFIDFQGTGNIAGTQDVILTSLTQSTPWRNTSASNVMSSWSGEVQYDFSAAGVDTFIQGFYPTLRVLTNGTTNFDINGTLTADADIIFGDGASLANIRHNSGTITAVNLTVRNGSDYTHAGASNLVMTLSATLSVFGRFIAESATNSYSLTATDIVVTQVITDGVFRFTDVNNTGSTVSLGNTATSGLVAGADTIVVIIGTFLTLLLFTGFISCTSPDTLELEFVHIDTNDVTSTALTINGNNAGATSLFVQDCDIDSPFMGWAFGGTAWTNTAVAQFIRNDVEIGVRITNDAKIGMTNSVIPDAGMDTGTGSLIVFGTVTAGNLIADIFGSFDAPGDVLATQSLEVGQRNIVNIRDPIIAGVTAVTVSAAQNINSWIMDATDTSGTVNATFELTTNLTSQLSNLEILGTYHHNNGGTLDIVGVNSLVRANSGGEFRISTACTVQMEDSTVLRVSNDSFITLTGVARSNRITFTRIVTAGNEPFIHIQEAATSGSGGINFNFVRITDFGAGNVAAVHVETNSAGVFDDVRFFDCTTALDISGATGTGAAQPGIQITSTSITDCGVGIQAIFPGPVNEKNVIQDVIIDGSSIGISFGGQSWEGVMHNVSSINNTTYGLQVAGSGSQFDNAPGSINHCVFHGDTADINMVAGANDPKLALTNCILSDKAVSAQVSPGGTAWQVISYNHNRVNTKEVIVYNDLIIDSNFTTPIHCDKFDWSGFNIAADGASYIVPAAGTPISELIPVQAGASYYIAFTGTLATFDVVETLLLGGTFTAASGLSSGAIHAVGVNSAYLQISWVGAVAGETLTHLEIREDTSGGDLIYNEDLINKFKSPNSGWEYDTSFGLAGTSGSPAVLPFGDFGYEFIDMSIDLPVIPSGDRAGIVLGWQNATNYYEVYLDGTNNDVRINKVIGGSPTLIDNASTFDGASVINVNANAYTLRVTWNIAANNAIQVILDRGVGETTIESTGWVTETTNDYVTDAQFDVGNVGLISEDIILDNLKVLHDGFYIREADLTLATGVTITVQSGGVFDTNEVTVNASQSVLNVLAGGTNNQVETTWLDENFDENVLGPQTLECGDTLEVTGDIVWGVAGEADWTGVTIQRTPETSTFRIITDAALTALPITARGISLPNVQPSIRPLDGSEGRYDLDPTKPSPSELVMPSADPVHRREVLENPVWGFDRARVTPWTMDSKRFTLRFFSKRDKCLWGKCEKWKDNATPLEVIYYRGIVWGVIITDVRAVRLRNNKSVHEWEVDFIEAR